MVVRLIAVVLTALLLGTAGGYAVPARADVEQAKRTGGLIALYPSDVDAHTLAIPGGAPPEELHLTLLDFGQDVRGRSDAELRQRIGDLVAQRLGPIEARAFGHAVFNPNDPQHVPSIVYLLGDSAPLASLRQQLISISQEFNQPTVAREPWVAHVTAAYGAAEKDLTYSGPVHFDRIGLSWAGTMTFWPL